MSNSLSKSLSSIQLWAIIVGTVISGSYFGWNYALQHTSPLGFILTVLIVTVFFATFMLSYAELPTTIPNAGGASEYASRAIGPFSGFIAGFSCLVEFLFAVPAIALSVGAYINYLVPSIPPVMAAVICYIMFVSTNLLGVKIAANAELIATILAVGGIVFFVVSGIGKTNFNSIISSNASIGGFKGILAAIPFALWFYLGAEGGAMSSEECRNPRKDIPRGFISGIITLVSLVLLVLCVSTSVGDVSRINNVDSPLPTALALILGEGNMISRFLSAIALFGLIASMHGVIIGYSRQTFAMARAGYFPKFLSYSDNKNNTPVWAIVLPSLIGIIFVLTGATATIIVISVMGAIIQYILSMISLFQLRKKEPDLQRPYKAAYPVVPAIALFLSVVFLIALIYINMSTVIFVVGTYLAASVFYFAYSKANILKYDLNIANK